MMSWPRFSLKQDTYKRIGVKLENMWISTAASGFRRRKRKKCRKGEKPEFESKCPNWWQNIAFSPVCFTIPHSHSFSSNVSNAKLHKLR